MFHNIPYANGSMSKAPRRRYSNIGEFDLQAVEGRLDILRQPLAQLVEVEVGMEIGQDSSFGAQALNPGQAFLDAKMARMRLVTRRIDDPDVQALQGSCAFVRH